MYTGVFSGVAVGSSECSIRWTASQGRSLLRKVTLRSSAKKVSYPSPAINAFTDSRKRMHFYQVMSIFINTCKIKRRLGCGTCLGRVLAALLSIALDRALPRYSGPLLLKYYLP